MSLTLRAPVARVILGVPDRTVMGIMGWSSTAMTARYQHITDPIRHEVAARVYGLIWSGAADNTAVAETTETKLRPLGKLGSGHSHDRGENAP
jgi:hypothetical protein